MPAILTQRPLAPVEAPAAVISTSHALAEVQAMADRMVSSMTFGRVGRDGHALRMNLSLGRRGIVGVSLSLSEDELEVTLEPRDASAAELAGLAAELEARLGVSVLLR